MAHPPPWNDGFETSLSPLDGLPIDPALLHLFYPFLEPNLSNMFYELPFTDTSETVNTSIATVDMAWNDEFGTFLSPSDGLPTDPALLHLPYPFFEPNLSNTSHEPLAADN